LVDGIEIPVRVTLQGGPDLAGNPNMNKVGWTDIAVELNLGILYHLVEDLWGDCLWNGYKPVDAGRTKAFLPQDLDLNRGYSIGLSRRLSLAMTFAAMGSRFQRGLFALGVLPNVREVRAIERVGKRQVIKVSKTGETTEALDELMVMRSYASEPYYVELLAEPLPLLGGLTLSTVLDAWIVISRAALVLVEAVGQKHAAEVSLDRATHTWLPNYAPTLHVGALVDALSAAAGIKPVDGKRLVEFFTFKGAPGQEIWAQPLVPVGPATVSPVFGAVVSPNLRRLVDVWMRQVGVDLSSRGPAFEAHIRATVAETIVQSKVLAGYAASVKDDYTFRPSKGREEQIDLLFVIGATVFLAEAKCILEPTEAKAVAMHRKTVEGAAEQAKRKAQALEANRDEFVVDMKRFDIDLANDFRVVPLVVVSTSTHVGVVAKDVAVTDELVLGRFLDGEIEDVGVQGPDFSVVKRLKTVFYSDAADAQAKAANYFASPPQLQRYLNGLRGRVVPVHPIGEGDWEGVVLTLECFPDRDLPIRPDSTLSSTT
jgi:hypothetical protein